MLNYLLKTLKTVSHGFVEGQKRRAAFHTAQYLVYHNKDFKNLSVHEVYNRILDESRPTDILGNKVAS